MNRRAFIGGFASAGLAQQRRYSLVIRNGEIRDPASGLKRRADLAIDGDRIAAIEDSIPADRAWESIDAGGLYVTPGLIDLHTHCYFGVSSLGVEADPIAARSGVTTWVDAGSFGWDQAAGFRRFIVEPAKARIFGYVYLYPSNRNPDHDPIEYARKGMQATADTIDKNRDILLGVKLQAGSNMSGKYSPGLFKVARELCDTFKLPLMVHISDAPPETTEVMDQMKPGDVVTHVYTSHSLGIIGADGKLKRGVKEARERGVIFDIGHGLGSFNFAAARKALDAGFVADTISTDIYNLNVNGPVFDMPTTMTKMLRLGMSFDDILRRVTVNPAKVINRIHGHGTLGAGAPADIALLAIEDGDFTLVDSQRTAVKASRRIVSRMTIVRGKRMREAV